MSQVITELTLIIKLKRQDWEIERIEQNIWKKKNRIVAMNCVISLRLEVLQYKAFL